jgi:hypothetical protein
LIFEGQMSLHVGAVAPLLIWAALSGAADGQEWTETVVIHKFLDQSPLIREGRARSATAEADARGRTLYSNPSLSYSRESAGFTEFLQAEQRLLISGRRGILREAGAPSIRAVEAEAAFALWEARSSLRQAFYRVLGSQNREALYLASLKELDQVIRILRDREQRKAKARNLIGCARSASVRKCWQS